MASMNEKDYYKILEVDEKATTDEIRRAFQKKARKLHPDVNKEPDAEERFKEVSEAYAVLSDADKRSRYDAMRSGVPFAGAGYPGGAGTGSPFDEGFPFGGAWTRRRAPRSYRPRTGEDVIYTIDLNAETARKGTKRGVTFQRYVSCDVCNGSGSVEHSEPITCPTCGGAGHIRIDFGGLGIFFAMDALTCPECEGAGKVVADPCSSCGGSGRVLSASEVVIEIPPDSHDGDEVRKEGMGNAGTNGRESGDFVCRVGVEEERLTQRQASGLRMLGLGLPLIIAGIISTVLFSFSVSFSILVGALFCGMGVASLVRGGFHGNKRWLRSALTALGSGLVSGSIICLLFFSMAFNPSFFIIAFFLALLLIPTVLSRRS